MSKALAQATAANEQKPRLPASTEADPFRKYVSKHKFAIFRLSSKEGEILKDSPEVWAFLTDGDKTLESQWQTPFENSNPELKMPMMMGGLQTGQTLIAMGTIGENIIGETAFNATKSTFSAVSDFMKSVEGKTNLNKVNTTQVFLSTASVRLSLSVFFIALRNAKTEVENKIMQLEAWSLPQELSSNTTLTEISDKGAEGLFSGIIPPFISLETHGKSYAPFVIESVSAPIVTPIDADGNRLNVAVNLNILSRAAWDARDLKRHYNRA
ncbi:hypothetical protein [Acinetobacter chinensis]|uniref:hypothetical protein n=1 Tax=Acinetobacter chinensis TaxID=2004650 RepID=UPI0029349740|nr:hypothetical protein [Acinetobacter chinensis]WOE40044.1 hypothetical protein QSG87_08970 [Acinetobacter chinensis]